MTRVIDLHAHVMVPEIQRDAAPDELWRPRVYREDGRENQTVEHNGRVVRSGLREWGDAEGIVADQDRAGTDLIALAPQVDVLFADAEPLEALRRGEIQNAGIERMVTEHPERIAGLGCVPLQDPPLAARALRELMGRGVLRGIIIPANLDGTFLGDDRFEPLWTAAEETGALVFVHPTRGFGLPVFDEHYLWNTAGNPLETALTAAHLVMTGTMERHPDLRILLSHGGGAVLALRGRLNHAHGFQPQARSRLRESPEASLRRFHYDTIVHDPDLLRALVATVGADRVVAGSDHPFDMGDLTPGASVRAAGLDPRDEALVLSGNAEALLGLEPAT